MVLIARENADCQEHRAPAEDLQLPAIDQASRWRTIQAQVCRIMSRFDRRRRDLHLLDLLLLRQLVLILVPEWILLPPALPPSRLVQVVVVLVVARSPPRTKTRRRQNDEYVNMNRMKWTTTERTQVTSTSWPHSLEIWLIILYPMYCRTWMINKQRAYWPNSNLARLACQGRRKRPCTDNKFSHYSRPLPRRRLLSAPLRKTSTHVAMFRCQVHRARKNSG